MDKSTVVVYVLECEHDGIYIGHTSSFEFRLKQHREKWAGSWFTDKYSVIKVISVIPCSFKERLFLENKVTRDYLHAHPGKRVCGGSYSIRKKIEDKYNLYHSIRNNGVHTPRDVPEGNCPNNTESL
jgi:predicted GIY-YIG superfamily endonuclease